MGEPFDLEKFIRVANGEAEEAAKQGISDSVAYSCKNAERSDKYYRPTFWKLQNRAEAILMIGEWAVDPDGTITDIVHVCDGAFQSPTALVPKDRRRAASNLKPPVLDREKYNLVCVTCAAQPTEDVHVVIELLTKRREIIGEANAGNSETIVG